MGIFKRIFANFMNGHHGGGYQGGHHGRSKHGGYYNSNSGASNNKVCMQCQSYVAPDARFCGQCGNDMSTATTCRCGAAIKMGSKFCGQCGASL
ncbi:zinc ribbon domain-containing protein [uncultured Legionella sp.]|uniref:zinc ribbon domain-containing protein n=1 Tax=uncultured Legionella sp. TaxID=210934 RepID=UPI002632696D|nr:zinc ribbon domain-containing protein [uncultured Legionella sp.]